jgi:hypothetical protein
MEWIILAIVLLLIWHNLMSKNAPAPVSPAMVVPTRKCDNSQVGDTFNSGHTMVPGVWEPVVLSCDANRGCGLPCVGPTLPINVHFPVAPPPIAIQKRLPAPAPIYHCNHISAGTFTVCTAKATTSPANPTPPLGNIVHQIVRPVAARPTTAARMQTANMYSEGSYQGDIKPPTMMLPSTCHSVRVFVSGGRL